MSWNGPCISTCICTSKRPETAACRIPTYPAHTLRQWRTAVVIEEIRAYRSRCGEVSAVIGSPASGMFVHTPTNMHAMVVGSGYHAISWAVECLIDTSVSRSRCGHPTLVWQVEGWDTCLPPYDSYYDASMIFSFLFCFAADIRRDCSIYPTLLALELHPALVGWLF